MKTIYTTPPPETQRNANIDCLKALLAILVVIIHFNIYSDWSEPFTAGAVPCFFLISGFLLYNDDSDKFLKRIIKNLKNIIKITALASILYLTFGTCIGDGDGGILSTKWIVQWVNGKTPGAPHLWYLYAYVYTLITFLILTKIQLIKYVKFIIIPLYLCAIFLGKYSFLFNIDSISIQWQRFLLDGVLFFTIGLTIKEYFDIIRKKIRHPLIIMIIFIILSYVEWCFLKILPEASGLIYIFTPIYTIFLFLSFTLNPPMSQSWFSRLGKDLSLYIYIFHIMLGSIFYMVPYHFYPEIVDLFWPFTRTVIVLTISVLFSMLFVYIKNRIAPPTK